MLKNKTVLLGVTGGIAAYKAAYLASALVKLHADVEVVMTANATQFVAPLLFEQLTGNRCAVDTFDRNFPHKVEHVALADKTDLVIIAPATANVCAKLAHGIADDMLTTTVLACRCPKLIAPAMNTKMFENPVTQDNLDILNRYGWEVISPTLGRLACGTVGLGKLSEPDLLVQHVLRAIALPHDLEGKRVLVSAGPTREALDPVRFLSNHSTGKMGYAIAKMAAFRGAEVVLVSGPTTLEPTPFAAVAHVVSAGEMFEAVTQRQDWADIIVMAAAVADYKPAQIADDKMKKGDADLSLPLQRTRDILGWLGEHRREGQILCGLSMETRDLVKNSRKKLEKKRVDLICANNLREAGAGFGVDTNVLTLISAKGINEDDLVLSVSRELFVSYDKVAAFREAINMAIASLSEPEESFSEPKEADAPLTLEELKAMYAADDSVVYVVHENRKFPAILDFYGGKLVAVWSALGHKNGLFEGDYGKTWLAYRNGSSNNIPSEPFFCPEIVMREPEHVFYELDGEPILYVCTDTNGVRCLCSCYQMSRNWIVGQVEEKTLIDLIDDRITIREAFEHCGTKLCVTWDWDGYDFVFAPGIPSDALPKAGARLELEGERTGEYRKLLAEKMVD